MLTIRNNRTAPTIVTSPFGRDFDRLFESMLPGMLSFGVPSQRQARFPALNVSEDQTSIHVEAELPGFKDDEIEISVVANELSIKGRRTEAQAADHATYHRRERWTGSFERSVALPVEVDAEKVAAELRNGVLSITLPKAQGALPRKIAVRTS